MVEQVLQDTIDNGFVDSKKRHLKKPKMKKAKFAEINTGINQFRHFVFVGNLKF